MIDSVATTLLTTLGVGFVGLGALIGIYSGIRQALFDRKWEKRWRLISGDIDKTIEGDG